MERDFDKTVQTFLDLLKGFSGSKPVFSIDYEKKEIVIKRACSGFVKIAVNVDKACTHMTEQGLTFNIFS